MEHEPHPGPGYFAGKAGAESAASIGVSIPVARQDIAGPMASKVRTCPHFSINIKYSKAAMSEHWSREEVEAAVAAYFNMLEKEVAGVPYNKAEHNRILLKMLPRRSRSSIEFKHRNISAVLIELGIGYLRGYRPLHNYQDLLRDVVEDRLAVAKQLKKIVRNAVEKPVKAPEVVNDILSILVSPPKRDVGPKGRRKTSVAFRKLPPRNYLEIESRNRSLGLAGEELVIKFEEHRLWRGGKKKLANQIEHVAHTRGDHVGFDILSFELDGRERLIEVKTTQFGAWTPFFISRNEVNVSEFRKDHYLLYRLYEFTQQPKLFTLRGALGRSCELEPIQFSALPKSVG